MKIKKEFIPYGQALALKELGFDGDCFAIWSGFDEKNFSMTDTIRLYSSGFRINDTQSSTFYINDFNSRRVSAPIFSQAFRWFRERYKLFTTICHDHRNINDVTPYFYMIDDCPFLDYKVYRTQEDVDIQKTLVYKTYEEAELECLKKLIEIIKNK